MSRTMNFGRGIAPDEVADTAAISPRAPWGLRRKPIERKTELARGDSKLTSKPWKEGAFSSLRPVSAERVKQFPARARCRKAVIARDGRCAAPRMLYAAVLGGPILDLLDRMPHWPKKCSGQTHVHEPLFRSAGGDFTDPEQCVSACEGHHDWAHAHAREAELIGFVVRRKAGAA